MIDVENWCDKVGPQLSRSVRVVVPQGCYNFDWKNGKEIIPCLVLTGDSRAAC